MSAIPSNKILDKISELAVQAKAAQIKEQQLGYILAIKALCELLEQETVSGAALHNAESSAVVDATIRKTEQKIIFEDANGSSLLDF